MARGFSEDKGGSKNGHEKCQDLMGSCPISEIQNQKPKWTCAVSVKDGYLQDKISEFTSGFRAINSNTIVLAGNGDNKIEGARWSRGFSSGKHVIEFIYPLHTRGPDARVGLGSADVALGGTCIDDLIGGQNSWALDLIKRKIWHNGRNSGMFPPAKFVLPDWFFMYIDLDNGLVHFASDGLYFGTAFTDVPSGTCLYPMVTASRKGACVSIVYRGQGKEVEGPLRKKRALPEKEGIRNNNNGRLPSTPALRPFIAGGYIRPINKR